MVDQVGRDGRQTTAGPAPKLAENLEKNERRAETASRVQRIGQVAHPSVNSRIVSKGWSKNSQNRFPKRTAHDR
jgi:hypothetical protein